MAPFIALVTVSLIARIVGFIGVDYVNSWPKALAVGLAAMFILTASAHFKQPRRDGLIAIVPPRIPYAKLMVTITGVLELVGAAGLLTSPSWIPGARIAAALGLGVLMIGMFPANIYAARKARHSHAPRTPLALRTVLQIVFLGCAAVVAGFT